MAYRKEFQGAGGPGGTGERVRPALRWDACLLLALLLLTVPFPWLAAAAAAGTFHELCHLGALRLLGIRVRRLELGAGGASMETEPMERCQELLAAAAGPLGSLALLGCLHRFPRLALCGGIQGIFNLLPVWPLDGGRILHCLFTLRYSEEKSRFLLGILEDLTLWALFLGAVTLSFVYFRGIAPVSLALAMVMKAKMRKTPCQDADQRVQ